MLHQVFRIIRHRNQSEHTDNDENSRLIADFETSELYTVHYRVHCV